jgi:predicted DNA-binding protein with PD1-like motif
MDSSSKAAPGRDASTCTVSLRQGDDIVAELRESLAANRWKAAAIISAAGTKALLQLGCSGVWTEIVGPFEIVSLAGIIEEASEYLYASLQDRAGVTSCGHLGSGSAVHINAEITLAEFDNLCFHPELWPI